MLGIFQYPYKRTKRRAKDEATLNPPEPRQFDGWILREVTRYGSLIAPSN